ncbi:MAG: ABC transporter permease [Planctomycetota bacterium]|nr:MAG: ABC transporter permease [Planctomycetota bacterium]REJ94264.1 MAG: ABC transporter permease [Planctomycetota bacterium]REK20238.1 MAG: ABC transporter permease [Planctomycetota bacterium]REK35430.1 MAG: ABC transporter permease [Planctomycetota bacterium]
MIPTVFGIMVVSFIVVQSAPGDPAAQKFGGAGQATAGLNAERGTEAAEKRFREKYHLDEPLYVQFGYFLQRFIKFDMIYFQQEKPIWPDLRDAILVTVKINLIVFFLIYLIAIPIGIYSAAFPHTPLDRLTTVTLFVLYSLPSFWAAEMLRIWLTDKTGAVWFPVMGLHSDNWRQMSSMERFLDYLHHIVLPVTCLTYAGLAYISRQMRAGMLEVIRQDYIRTARAKGCSKPRVILVHALRNGLFPIITLFASLLPFLIGGSVIIETIFSIPGMGRFAFEGMLRREYDQVMTTLTLSAVMTLLGILISDIAYVLVNPQVTFDERS